MPARKKSSKATAIKVNLLPKDSFSESSLGKAIDWALTTGRYIVIFTEMVVILTFLQRFNLDRQLSDLNDSIFQRQAVLESYQQIESSARALQSKAEFIEELEQKVDILPVLAFLTESAPQDVLFDDLSVRNQVFSVRGTAYSQTSLSLFVDLVKTYPGVTDVSLDSLSQTGNSTGIDFNLRVDFTLEKDQG